MKNYAIFLTAALALAAVTACQKKEQAPAPVAPAPAMESAPAPESVPAAPEQK